MDNKFYGIADAPRDGTVILAWHLLWKCWLPVKWQPEGLSHGCKWIEPTLAVAWPEEAFDYWMPHPAGPRETERAPTVVAAKRVLCNNSQ